MTASVDIEDGPAAGELRTRVYSCLIPLHASENSSRFTKQAKCIASSDTVKPDATRSGSLVRRVE
jgi:hypothetical protein